MKMYRISMTNGNSYVVEYNGSLDEVRLYSEKCTYMTFIAVYEDGKYNVSLRCEYIVSIVEMHD